MTLIKSEKTLRVLVVDDHPPFAEGLAALINQQIDMHSVGIAENGEKALQCVRSAQPEVVVMDISMPGINGIEATKLIKKEFPNIVILILSAYAQEPYILLALEAGADGYMTKNAPMTELLKAIRTLRDGDLVLEPKLATKLLRSIVRSSGVTQVCRLDKNELELLKLGARGINIREIAIQMYLSERTVQSRFTAVYEKLGVASRMEAVLKALKEGWLTIDDL